MQAIFAHHVLWTVIGTTGVIFSAAYMLSLIQRVFYGESALRPAEVNGWDMDLREHITLWPLVLLFLTMGIASPLWMRSIDIAGTGLARTLPQPQTPVKGFETEHQADQDKPAAQGGSFVDPALKAAALGKKAPPVNQGARY